MQNRFSATETCEAFDWGTELSLWQRWHPVRPFMQWYNQTASMPNMTNVSGTSLDEVPTVISKDPYPTTYYGAHGWYVNTVSAAC